MSFTQAGFYGEVDDFTGRVGHQTTHASHLGDLRDVTFGPGSGHHINTTVAVKGIRDGAGNTVHGFHPDTHDAVISLALGYQASVILVVDDGYSLLRFLEHLGLAFRHLNIVHGNGDAGLGSITEAQLLDAVKDSGGVFIREYPAAL